ncbi:hypothetical protein FRC07_002743 [Ceratobasidium sp. 392]|nr:hypothetical protein FRC07_002743 [Ceratobasidium sp. 392]
MPNLGPSQAPRGFQLRIDTSVPSPSLNVPHSTVSTCQSPASPNTPALARSATTVGSSAYPGTPASSAPWSAHSPVLRRPSDFESQGYENSVHSGEPRDSKPWSLKRVGSAFRSIRKSRVLQEADPQLAELTAGVIVRGLDDWSLVEEVCRSAATHTANADCVLKSVIRCIITGDGFQQLSAARLWAILMKKANSVVVVQASQPEFLKSLERVISSHAIEMVAIDRLVAVLTTVIHDRQSQDEADRFCQLWSRISLRRQIDSTPLSSDDAIYRPGSLVPSSRGSVHQDATIANPYSVPPATPTITNSPAEIVPPCDDPKAKAKLALGAGPTIQVIAPTETHPGAAYFEQARDLPDQFPPPYSACSIPCSEPGPSTLGHSVVDTYPFAKGYASDVGPDIDIGSIESHPFARGAFGDVRRAYLRNGTRIAIKCLRFYTSARDTGRHRLEKKSLKEIRVWSFLDHENVLPLIGLCVINNELGMVSEFMPNGNVQEYIQRNPGVDRYQLAINICAGLAYLHEHPKRVVHGDLKAVNVVVDANGIPKLTDFGLAQMVRAEDSMERSSSSGVGGTARWMAYEQLFPVAPEMVCQRPNAQSDVYSLGMTLYEIFSGKLPFSELRNEPQVIRAVMDGILPTRITSVFPEPLWHLLNSCWCRNPHERPSTREVLTCLQGLATQA